MDVYYGRAWLLTHMLYNDPAHAGRLGAYIDAINKGVEAQKAATDTLGDLAQLDRDLNAYLKRRLTYRTSAASMPVAGVVTFADDLYLTGGTILLDHGHGVGSNFLHLSRMDVKAGDRVTQGQVVGAVGATGRATGPHLHWGMSWFDVRVDPLLVLERTR